MMRKYAQYFNLICRRRPADPVEGSSICINNAKKNILTILKNCVDYTILMI